MRNNPQKITLCLDLFYRGISTRKIQEHLQAFYPHNSSNVSIYSWVVKYARIISKFTDNLKLRIGEEVQIDEMEYKTKGKQSFFIDCMDTKTRFIIASNYLSKLNKYNVVHNRVNARKGEGFNYPIERTHNNIRARTKTFRGFHGNIKSANAIMKGLEIYLNFIREHLAIGCCPYELAIPNLKLGVNKWLDLISLSKTSLTIK